MSDANTVDNVVEKPSSESPLSKNTAAIDVNQAMTKTIVRRQSVVSEQLAESDLSPLLAQLYANRNITHIDEVRYSLECLLDYRLLKDCEKAACLIADAVEKNNMLLIVGDYDADGATSTAVMLRALKAFGHDNCNHLVPNRFDYGYGLSPEIVEVARDYQPDLIITVDNGIASIAGVARAQQYGIPVIVTDHHLAGDDLPEAAAIVNPNQPGCDFPSKVIAGVGVAFYVMLAVRAELRKRGRFERRTCPNMASLLDLVALGTVADVVPLDANNRIFVDQGLKRIRSGVCCAGIASLLQLAGRNQRSCCTQDFGFAIAPRLNAAGRLEDMSIGIACLLSDDTTQANELAHILDDINRQRRSIEADMLQQANSIIDAQVIDEQLTVFTADNNSVAVPHAVCLYRNDWHQGVVGLLASRIKERIHRPVIAFACADLDSNASDTVAGHAELKGSARSIPGVHIRDVLDIIDKRVPGLIIKFGGHAMAAGLSIKASSLQQFETELVRAVSDVVSEDMLNQSIESDGPVAAAQMTLSNAELIRYAGPWGQCFHEPVFDDVFELADWRIVGEKHLKMQLRMPGHNMLIDAIAFNHTGTDLPTGGQLHAAFRMDVNEFRGNKKLQLIVECIQPVSV